MNDDKLTPGSGPHDDPAPLTDLSSQPADAETAFKLDPTPVPPAGAAPMTPAADTPSGPTDSPGARPGAFMWPPSVPLSSQISPGADRPADRPAWLDQPSTAAAPLTGEDRPGGPTPPVHAADPASASAADTPPLTPPAPLTAPTPLTFPHGTVDLTEQAPPAPLAAPQPAAPAPGFASLYRDAPAMEPVPGTVEVDQPVAAQGGETVIMGNESLLGDHRAARARALGEVEPGADVVAAPRLFTPPTVYNKWPSFTLFLFRLIIAAILAIRATQELIHFSDTKTWWTRSLLGNPEIFATGQIVAEYVIALMLLLGLASRAAGVLMLVMYVFILSFVVWGASNPLVDGVLGFDGEFEVSMAAAGLLFAGVGGGGAAVDAIVHRARLERKNAKLGG